jgi:hypothetical protein
MKKIKLIFILFLISPIFIMAQDYQTLKSDRIAFFSNVYGGVNCIRIDSVEFNTDSVFYPFSNIQQIGMIVLHLTGLYGLLMKSLPPESIYSGFQKME